MTQPTTAREALIAEALGDVAALIGRVEALVPAMDKVHRALLQARSDLVRQGEAFERQVSTLTEGAKAAAIAHVARRTEALGRASLDMQTQAMAEAARTLFASEIRHALERLIQPLQQSATRRGKPWWPWLTHLVAATASSALTAVLMLALRAP